jgi:hypothetical protein
MMRKKKQNTIKDASYVALNGLKEIRQGID